jgi:hypothetical protein
MKQKTSLRQVRFFSEAIKKKVVKDIEDGKVTVLAVSRELGTPFLALCFDPFLKKARRRKMYCKKI